MNAWSKATINTEKNKKKIIKVILNVIIEIFKSIVQRGKYDLIHLSS